MDILKNDTREIRFHLANGDVIHACLDCIPTGATRICIYTESGNVAVLPVESRAVQITTTTQLAKLAQ